MSPIPPARPPTCSSSTTRSTGSYEVSVDAYVGPWAGSVVAHNGLCILPSTVDGNAQVYPVGQGETLQIPWKLSRPEGFNRLTIQVGPGKVRYLVNGHLLYEDEDPSPISPWLGLLTFRERYSAWRNLASQGEPDHPPRGAAHPGRSPRGLGVQLLRRDPAVAADRPGHRPVRQRDHRAGRTASVAAEAASRSRKPNTTVNVDDYDWAAKDGVIHGRRHLPDATTVNYYDPTSTGSVTEADQSRLYYHRPLGDGDAISYEFLYEPGQVMVHPAIDRLAFLLEPGGCQAALDDLGRQ